MVEMGQANPNEARELNVMVSDIRDEYADALRVLLEPHGFTIRRVRSGADAIRLAEKRAVDAAVLDNELPDMPGLRVLRIIRSLDQLMPIILVGLAGRRGEPAYLGEQEHLLQAALELQAFSVLAEPVDLEVLLGQMARVFDHFAAVMRSGAQAEARPGSLTWSKEPQPTRPDEPPADTRAPGGLVRRIRLLRFTRRPGPDATGGRRQG